MNLRTTHLHWNPRRSNAAILAGLLLWSLASPVLAEVPESYRKMWSGLREQIDANIERYRKGDVTVELVDADGKPIADATLDIQQKTHHFLFGCNILPLGQLDEKNEAYEKAFVKLFNLATTTFCWGTLEPEQGTLRFEEGSEEIWRRPPPDRVLKFCQKHGIKCKGQPLFTDNWLPKWAKGMSAEELRPLVVAHLKRVADRYGESFYMFDVVNEQFCCKAGRSPGFPLLTPDLAYVPWTFNAAAPLFPPSCRLTINEATGFAHFGNIAAGKNGYYNLVRRMIDGGTRVDGVGFQFHLFSNRDLQRFMEDTYLRPQNLLDTYTTFGDTLNRPLYITEITVPATLKPGAEGEAIQAQVVADLYRLWFSVPHMAGITYWNLCDGAAWMNEGKVLGGLLDEHMREKPSYQTLYQLIHREWKTYLTAKSDQEGRVPFRGFLGKYRVTATVGKKSKTFEIDLSQDVQGPCRLVLE